MSIYEIVSYTSLLFCGSHLMSHGIFNMLKRHKLHTHDKDHSFSESDYAYFYKHIGRIGKIQLFLTFFLSVTPILFLFPHLIHFFSFATLFITQFLAYKETHPTYEKQKKNWKQRLKAFGSDVFRSVKDNFFHYIHNTSKKEKIVDFSLFSIVGFLIQCYSYISEYANPHLVNDMMTLLTIVLFFFFTTCTGITLFKHLFKNDEGEFFKELKKYHDQYHVNFNLFKKTKESITHEEKEIG